MGDPQIRIALLASLVAASTCHVTSRHVTSCQQGNKIRAINYNAMTIKDHQGESKVLLHQSINQSKQNTHLPTVEAFEAQGNSNLRIIR